MTDTIARKAAGAWEPVEIDSFEARAARAIANARRAGELSIAVKSPMDYQMFVDQVAALIAAQYEPVMEVLREAIREGYAYGRGVVECVECKSRGRSERKIIHGGSCWVSRAREIVGEA